MPANSAKELENACQVFIAKLAQHHATVGDVLTQFANDLEAWAGEAEGWVDAELNKIRDEWQQQHQQQVNLFHQFLELQHQTAMPNIMNAVAELSAKITG